MPSITTPGAPDASSLHQAALTYVARYAATEAGLRRVLIRQVDRWARTQPDGQAAAPAIAAAKQAIDEVVGRMVQAGAVSDTAFAETRAKRLIRTGQSSRVVQSRLIAKGVAPDLARAASVSDDETELAAALVLTRKRRIGPYRAADDDGSAARVTDKPRVKELALLARAGFPQEIAMRALDMSREESESRIFDLKR